MKKSRASLLVGDRVLFEKAAGMENGKKEGIIEKVLPRTNALNRPPAANVDQMILVLALRDPAPDWHLCSRILAMAEQQEMAAVLCLNKADMLKPSELADIARLLDHFPYPYIFTSAALGQGIDRLKELLRGRCSIFAGPSGAGKSSILNILQPGLNLRTGAVSDRIGRGRHTTRVAELMILPEGGMVVDTPGFSRLEFEGLEPRSLPSLFPEMEPFAGRCAYRDCSHINEPRCAVQDAVSAREINAMRFAHYKTFFQELESKRGDY